MNLQDAPHLGNRNSQHSFAQIPKANVARSSFNRSHAVKDTIDFDILNPMYVDEVLPGDTINLNLKSFARLATQVVPLMDNMYMDYFFFFVPTRLVWDNWEKFNGAQDDPGDSTDFLIPQVVAGAGGFAVGSMFDKLGVPTDVPNLSVNCLPFRCVNLIYNEWFRDQNLINSKTLFTGDGPDPTGHFSLDKRAKKHDYFTSCLPWPQKGSAVTLPLGSSAPVVANGNTIQMEGTGTSAVIDVGWSSTTGVTGFTGSPNNGELLEFGPETGLQADLSSATASTINAIREAFMVQSLLELDARGGTRYVEIIKAHFNVISPDFRLQRPEFLSSGTTMINQHPVPQTSQTSGANYQADLAAFSTSSNMGNRIGFTKSFTEHGYVIGIVQARADITYQQGLHRMWSRSTRYDFYWPKLQELGEQAVLNSEIYCTGTATDDDVFGYQERFADYRYKPSEIRGQFRSTYSSPLDVWHLAEEFGTAPALNGTFIESNTPIDRSLTVGGSYPHLLVDLFFDIKHARPMMTYGIPATLGRF